MMFKEIPTKSEQTTKKIYSGTEIWCPVFDELEVF